MRPPLYPYLRLVHRISLLSVTAVALAACAPRTTRLPEPAMGDEAAKVRARADSLRYPYTQADIDFMSGMIHHHAQAITMSKWAPTNGASPAIQRLTGRIINAQTDEIALMQTWLKDRNQSPPTVDSLGNVTMGGHAGHAMAGHDMGGMAMGGAVTMPGMLSDQQMQELKAARGTEFDRLFLTYMIQHHRGAVTMVKTLFSAHGAGQDETIFKFANDVEVDQSTEIKRMISMMLEMGFVPPPPA